MAFYNSTASLGKMQGLPLGLAEVQAILDSIDASALLLVLWQYRWNGRPGYPVHVLWRAHLARFLLNLPSVNALIRRLQDDPGLMLVCGFSSLPGGQTGLPHRTTFNRFFTRLALHQDLVDQAMAPVTRRLHRTLPGFGENLAVDSTVIRTHSNPNRPLVSDPEASWTAKNSARARDGKDWYFGYKEHALVDATYGLPIVRFTTTASRNDSPELPNLMDKAARTHDWFAPVHVMADKGYDSVANHRAVLERGAIPIIALRNTPGRKRREGIYCQDGVPTCVGNVRMEYVRTDPAKGRLYRCRGAGCPLQDRQGVLYCRDELWENRQDNPRLFGLVRRGSREWDALYCLRQSVERVFKSLKQSRSLEAHCSRGLKRVGLHAAMAMLAFQATALYRLQTGQEGWMRWQVRRVA